MIKIPPNLKTNLAETNKNSAHGLEVKGLITVEHKHKATQLVAQSLDRLCLACTCWTCGVKQLSTVTAMYCTIHHKSVVNWMTHIIQQTWQFQTAPFHYDIHLTSFLFPSHSMVDTSKESNPVNMVAITSNNSSTYQRVSLQDEPPEPESWWGNSGQWGVSVPAYLVPQGTQTHS